MLCDHQLIQIPLSSLHSAQANKLWLASYFPQEFSVPRINNYSQEPQQENQSSKGKWSQDEQILYKKFLGDHLVLFQDKSTRKSNKVFLKMSGIITTRTPQQCRTHHQKMFKFHGSQEAILNSPSRLRRASQTIEQKKGRRASTRVEKRTDSR